MFSKFITFVVATLPPDVCLDALKEFYLGPIFPRDSGELYLTGSSMSLR